MSTGHLAITWLGHSAFQVLTPGGKTLLFDPWYTGNPKFPAGREPQHADLILVSHGHSDHTADAAAIAKKTGAPVVAIYEITSWLGQKGVTNVQPMNKGGTIEVAGHRAPLVRTYGDADAGALVALTGSNGFVEVAIREGNAAATLGLTRGARVVLRAR